jgi:hypothetical protein
MLQIPIANNPDIQIRTLWNRYRSLLSIMKEKATYDFSLEKNNGKREEIFRRSVSQRLMLTWGGPGSHCQQRLHTRPHW